MDQQITVQARSGQFARPADRSTTRRHQRAADASRYLSQYRNAMPTAANGAEPNLARTMRLLHAIAAAERALYDETGGRYGDPQATPGAVLRRTSRQALD